MQFRFLSQIQQLRVSPWEILHCWLRQINNTEKLSKIFSISRSFPENLQNHMLAPPSPEGWRPLLRESWITPGVDHSKQSNGDWTTDSPVADPWFPKWEAPTPCGWRSKPRSNKSQTYPTAPSCVSMMLCRETLWHLPANRWKIEIDNLDLHKF